MRHKFNANGIGPCCSCGWNGVSGIRKHRREEWKTHIAVAKLMRPTHTPESEEGAK